MEPSMLRRKRDGYRRSPRAILALAAVLVVGDEACFGLKALEHSPRPTLDRSPTPEEMARFWVSPTDLEERDLALGVGGAKLAPDPSATYQFVKKKTGRSPGYTVKDPAGLAWSTKLGPEARSEVAVSRLLWAIGYHQPPVYHLAGWTLAGGPQPGVQSGARFRPDLWKKIGPWDWYANPYVATRPYKGLVAFMRIVNNWDLLNRNNMVYEVAGDGAGARRLFVVKDLGASFGKTMLLPHQGTKDVLVDFERQRFIKKVAEDEVRFEDVGRRHRGLYRKIAPSDVRWMCELLSRLSPKQWDDAFRSGGYSAEESARFIARIKQKIADGLSLPGA